jgi:hypothetical protein
MPMTIDNLKKLFTQDEKYSFNMMHALTIQAMDAFALIDRACFIEDNSLYSRDRNCKSNFTMLNVVIRDVMSDTVDRNELSQLLKEIPQAMSELTASLNIFLKGDSNVNRKIIYTNALAYIAKIHSCFLAEDLRQDSVADSFSYSTPRK